MLAGTGAYGGEQTLLEDDNLHSANGLWCGTIIIVKAAIILLHYFDFSSFLFFSLNPSQAS